MTEGRGVARWVVPKKHSGPAARSINSENIKGYRSDNELRANANINRRNADVSPILHNDPTYSSDTHFGDRHFQNCHPVIVQHADDVTNRQEATQLDDAICRTICVIVEQYLKELREHQRKINDARAKLIRDGPQFRHDRCYIAHNDISRLSVRDEQTKAIETIKQLTNYLKELSYIKRQEASRASKVGEDIHNKLSDLRNDIINTLNDFVLANNDIDMPIVDPDDPTGGRDYDLCIEAQISNRDIREIELSHSSVTDLKSIGNNIDSSSEKARKHDQQLRKRPLADRANISVESNHHETVPTEPDIGDKYKLSTVQDDYQLIEVDKRKRDIHKLEKDTMELRNLFADFYNLVKMQGEQVDTIEDNLVMAAQNLSDGRNHLSQRPMRGLTVLLPMTGCITGALIGGPIGFFVGGKLGGVTVICATSLLGLLSSLGAQKCIENNKMK